MKRSERQEQPKHPEKISPTAWGVAYRRTFTDIPLSQEIFNALEEIHKRDLNQTEDFQIKSIIELTPYFEARFKIINHLLAQTGQTQILELAAGMSPRGIIMTVNPDIKYVELDLDQMIREKREIVDFLSSGSISPRPNLYFQEGNVTNNIEMERAVSHFDSQREIAIVNEGLLRYLTHANKSQLAESIHQILKRFGGVWITPDIIQSRNQMRSAVMQNPIVKSSNKQIEESAQINIKENIFEDEEGWRDFFENLGFNIESHSYTEIEDELVSPKRLNIDPEKVRDQLNWSKVFVMKTK